MGVLDDFFKKNTKRTELQKESAHVSFGTCDRVYKSTLGDPDLNQMDLLIGKVDGRDKILLSFGSGNPPYVLEKHHYLYLVAALTKVGNKLFEEGFKQDMKTEITNGLKDGSCLPMVGSSIGKSSPSEEELTPEELKEFLKGKLPDDVKVDDIDLSSFNEMKEKIEDFEKIMESMSDEDRAVLEKAAAAEREKLIYEKAKALEAELLGEIEVEEVKQRDYKFYKKIYIDKGPEAMREELAKLGKEERKSIIDQVIKDLKDEDNHDN